MYAFTWPIRTIKAVVLSRSELKCLYLAGLPCVCKTNFTSVTLIGKATVCKGMIYGKQYEFQWGLILSRETFRDVMRSNSVPGNYILPVCAITSSSYITLTETHACALDDRTDK